MAEGGCLCGAIRFTVTGPDKGVGYCHCESCRRQTGAPVAAFVVFSEDQVVWLQGERKRYESSPRRFRSFCEICGASLTFEDHRQSPALVEFHVSALDHPDAFPPNEHTHYAERISWLGLSDDLTKYPGSMEIE
ncbi:MAG: GFA family protein [Pseudomonadota bacterium]